jgi:hypothetical protein
MTFTKRALLLLAIAGGLLAAAQATIASAGAVTTITTTPAAPPGSPDNCWPFGVGPNSTWGPFAGFVYKNIPAFQLKVGDTIGFDLGAVNDADVQVDVALAATTANGGDIPAQGFINVATNTQTPANPRGDTIAGDYELRFTAEAPFSFGGGGLIVRFSHASVTYAGDITCTAVAFDGFTATDASRFFVERFAHDADGNSPWDYTDSGPMVPFRLTLADTPAPPPPGSTGPTGQRAAALKKCKKKFPKGPKRKKCIKRAKRLPL